VMLDSSRGSRPCLLVTGPSVQPSPDRREEQQRIPGGHSGHRSLLVGGGLLVGIGGLLGFTGMVLVGSPLLSATRQWVNQLEQPPSELARRKWQQAKAAASAGAEAWRNGPQTRSSPS
jgi:hypothetical protein